MFSLNWGSNFQSKPILQGCEDSELKKIKRKIICWGDIVPDLFWDHPWFFKQ